MALGLLVGHDHVDVACAHGEGNVTALGQRHLAVVGVGSSPVNGGRGVYAVDRRIDRQAAERKALLQEVIDLHHGLIVCVGLHVDLHTLVLFGHAHRTVGMAESCVAGVGVGHGGVKGINRVGVRSGIKVRIQIGGDGGLVTRFILFVTRLRFLREEHPELVAGHVPEGHGHGDHPGRRAKHRDHKGVVGVLLVGEAVAPVRVGLPGHIRGKEMGHGIPVPVGIGDLDRGGITDLGMDIQLHAQAAVKVLDLFAVGVRPHRPDCGVTVYLQFCGVFRATAVDDLQQGRILLIRGLGGIGVKEVKVAGEVGKQLQVAVGVAGGDPLPGRVGVVLRLAVGTRTVFPRTDGKMGGVA